MSKAVKKFKKAVKSGFKSIKNTVKGAVKGDLSDIANVLSLGATGAVEKSVTAPLKALSSAITPDLPSIPDIPTAGEIASQIDIPEPTSQGAVQGNIGTAAPDINLGATEGKRRRSGSALGRRKLRVPLGGLS